MVTTGQIYLDHYYSIAIFMAAHHSITWVIIFSTNQLWSCAFGCCTYDSLVLELKGLEHRSLDNQCACHLEAAEHCEVNM